MTNGANNAGYNVTGKFVYASFDDNPEDAKIDFKEADEHKGSVFSKLEDEIIQSSISQAQQAQNKVNLDLIKKYFNVSLISEIRAAFQTINYGSTQEIADDEHYDEAQQDVDTKLEGQINDQIESIKRNLHKKYDAKIKEAIQNAERQQFGVQQGQSNTVSYYEYEGDSSNIATFDSAGPDTDDSQRSQGYKTTVDNLVNNHKAKSWKREVDGQMQTIYEFKDPESKEKVCVIVDDAGQIHKLKTTTTLGKNTYVTEDAVEMARQLVGYTTDIDVKRRKVDGQYQVVVRYKDNDGKEHVKVIDRNEITGQISLSDDLEHVSHGGKAKYASETSGFENNTDAESLNVSVRREKGRDIIDKFGIADAMKKLTPEIKAKGGSVTLSSPALGDNNFDATYTVKLNNHTYTFNNGADNKTADRMMRLIKAELNSMTTHKQAGPVDLTLEVNEDSRDDANGVSAQSTTGQTEMNWGVDNPENHQSKSTSVRKIEYTKDFTKADFQNQGWKRSPNGEREIKILKEMDSQNVKGNEKSVRNLKNATEFATRFLKASGVDPKDYDINKLANALKTVNPSFFDSNGNMYKNVDFARLNLPAEIGAYKLS